MRNIVTELHTPRLILRRFIPSDLYDFYEMASDIGHFELAGWKSQRNLDDAKVMLDDFIKQDIFAITRKKDHKLIGFLSLDEVIIREEGEGLEIGYVIGKKYEKEGFATEAVREIVRYSFYRLGLNYLAIGYSLDNVKSARIAEKCGFKPKERYDYHNKATGMIEPSFNAVLYREDYNKAHEFYQIYDRYMHPVDMMIERPSYVPDGYYFGVVDIITYNKNNGCFLITRRDKNKPFLPGMLECTCGAMQYGEKPLSAAIREVKEETGIKAGKMTLISSRIHRHAATFIYLNACDVKPDSVVLQENETDAYFWYSPEEFVKLFKTDVVTEVQSNRLLPLLPEILKKIKEK